MTWRAYHFVVAVWKAKGALCEDMRPFFVLICSFALVCAARGEKQQTKETVHAKTSQHAATHSEHSTNSGAHQTTAGSTHVQHAQPPQHVAPPAGHPAGVPSRSHPTQVVQPGQPQSQRGAPQAATAVQPAARPLTSEQQAEIYVQDRGFRSAEQYRKWKETGRVETSGSVATTRAPAGEHGLATAGSAAASHAGVHPFPSRHFDLQNTAAPGIEHLKFQPGNHIPRCEEWRDSRYNVFRKYTAAWHDRDWWRSHYPRIVFALGGWYYWHANYWYPAWGYQPEAVYGYDGPIYAFNDLEPDQVVANVQATLQQLGYYHGPINGVLDPATQDAIANYQRDHGLYATSAIDEPTLASLGMA